MARDIFYKSTSRYEKAFVLYVVKNKIDFSHIVIKLTAFLIEM